MDAYDKKKELCAAIIANLDDCDIKTLMLILRIIIERLKN